MKYFFLLSGILDDGQLLIQQAASTDGPGLVRKVIQYSPGVIVYISLEIFVLLAWSTF